MTFEEEFLACLKAITPRVHADFAPVTTARPYVTFQQVGGDVINPLDNSAPGKRLPEMQVNVWADNRMQAMALIRAIEDALRAASAFHARPAGDAVADFDADVPVYGARQDFFCRYPK